MNQISKNEESIKDPWGTMKHTSICIMNESPRKRRERKMWQKEYLKK